MNHIEKFFKNHSKEKLTTSPASFILYRLLIAYTFVSTATYAFAQDFYNVKTFYSNLNFLYFLAGITLITLFLFFIKSDKTIRTLFLLSTSAYFVFTAIYVNNHYISFGLCLLQCMAVYYTETSDFQLELKSNVLFRIILMCFIFTFLLHTITIPILHYINYGTPCYDFGLFAQMFHYMKTTGAAMATCERDKLLSHFAVHFSPIYYVLLPFYFLFPSPITLLVLQPLVLISGIIPLLLLCKHFRFSKTETLLFAFCFTFYPAFSGGASYYLHENCFLVPFLLWIFYFYETEKTAGIFIFAILTLCVKEDAAVYVAIISLYFLFRKKKPGFSLFLFAFSVIAFVSITHLMQFYGEGIMSNSRYGDYIYDDNGLVTVIKSVLLNPLFALKHVCQPQKIEFILQMLLPLCFLPLCLKKPSKLILLIPFILIHLLTNYKYQFDINYQYVFGTGAIFLYLALSNYSELEHKKASIKHLLCAGLCTIILFTSLELPRWNYVNTFMEEKNQRKIIESSIDLVPKEADVSASTFFIANMSKRNILYELETTGNHADYVVVDLRKGKDAVDVTKFYTEDYETIFYQKNVIGIFKSTL